MKRKRGPKKGHKKGKHNDHIIANDPASAQIFINTEDTIYLAENIDDSQNDSEMDPEPPPIEPDKPSNVSSIDSEHLNGKSIGRLKVKLKSSRTLEPHRSYSNMQTPSSTDRGYQHAAMELNSTAVEMEDSAISNGQMSEMQNNISEFVPKKAGIKIKSIKARDLSSENVDDKICNRSESPPHMQIQLKQPNRDSHYNEKELSASLTVIKKIMKMDAAEPFNAPVDPVALGIPDYFEYIDTPMDFGTICRDLENGGKYMNSEDVFKDVKYIWENCYKYNNKGDYVVDLMKRVKKNFMKYWMAAGLYSDQAMNADTENIEDDITFSQDMYYKGKKHKHRKHGIDLHKSDCLCAVCVVRRRKKEKDRENNLIAAGSKLNASNGNQLMGFKTEVSSQVNRSSSNDVTSSRDQSEEIDANAYDVEVENEEKFETPEQKYRHVKQEAMNDDAEPFMHMSLDNGNGDDPSKHSQEQDFDSFTSENGELKDLAEIHQRDQDGERKHVESGKRAFFLENPLLQENHSILPICGSLFPSKVKSVRNGPHSFMRRKASSGRESLIHSALASFMK